MEFKGTPGEWYIKFMDKNDPDSDFWVKSDSNDVVHYGTDIMCEDYHEGNGYTREQRMADAKIIIASKPMLKALLELQAAKAYKDTHGKDEIYELMRKAAWEAAEEATNIALK